MSRPPSNFRVACTPLTRGSDRSQEEEWRSVLVTLGQDADYRDSVLPPGVLDGRGDEPFVEVSWDEALDLLSAELQRVYATHGSSGVYGASYVHGVRIRVDGEVAPAHRLGFFKQLL